MSITSSARLRHAELEAVVIRKDGTVEDLGVISYYHRNPLRRLWFQVKKFLGV